MLKFFTLYADKGYTNGEVTQMKIEYRGYTIVETGMIKIWRLTHPDDRASLLRPNQDWDFTDEEEFYEYIDSLVLRTEWSKND